MGFTRRDLLSRFSLGAGGLVVGSLVGHRAFAQGYNDTPMLPGGHWRVHDSKRPQPMIITPGATSFTSAPSDGVALFDGTDLSKWKSDKADAKWKVENGYFEVVAGTGSITTRDEFGDCQFHLEFMAPNPPKSKDQGRGNSGVFMLGRYEFQVLDCYDNKTYADGMTGSIYGQTPPLVNACRKPGEWQTYDIVFVGPRFAEDGKLLSPAMATVFLNGILVQHATPLIGGTEHRTVGKYTPHPTKGAISLQDHGDPVRYRNIWIREIGPYEEIARREMNQIG